jgi:hypothetical protein
MINSTNHKLLHISASVWKEAKESNGALQGSQNKKTKSINENPQWTNYRTAVEIGKYLTQ